jgi:hypothetical protein
VRRLSGRLLLAHGADDYSIPFTESLRLAEAAPGRTSLVVFRTFHHTGPVPLWPSLGARAADAWHLFRLADQLLAQASPSTAKVKTATMALHERREEIWRTGHREEARELLQ